MTREAREARQREAHEWLVALGIFLATLVVGSVLVVGVLFLLAEPIGGPDQAGEVPAVDRSPLTCEAHHDQVPTPPHDETPVAMLICTDPEGRQPWTAPAELVEGDLGELADVLADLEPAPLDDYPCEMVGGPSYELVLRFSGGRVAQVDGDTGGCGVVTVGSVEYFGEVTLLDTALALAEENRVGRTPPEDVPLADLSCDRTFTEDGLATSYTGEPGDLVRMVSCWQPNAPELGAWAQTELNDSDVRVLARDLGRRAEVGGDPKGLRCPGGLRRHYFQHLVGQTSWGDVLVIAGECRRFIVVDTRGRGETIVWRPSTDAQRLLDNLRR